MIKLNTLNQLHRNNFDLDNDAGNAVCGGRICTTDATKEEYTKFLIDNRDRMGAPAHTESPLVGTCAVLW